MASTGQLNIFITTESSIGLFCFRDLTTFHRTYYVKEHVLGTARAGMPLTPSQPSECTYMVETALTVD